MFLIPLYNNCSVCFFRDGSPDEMATSCTVEGDAGFLSRFGVYWLTLHLNGQTFEVFS